MKAFKPIKRLPFFVKMAVEMVDEEVWTATANETGNGGLSKEEMKQLKEFVLKLMNKAAKRAYEEQDNAKE